MARKKSTSLYYDAWTSAWGPIGAAAGAEGLTAFVLPSYTMDDLLQLLPWEHPGAQRDPEPFELLRQLTRDYFNARPADFSEVACGLPAESTFGGKVLRACREMAYGETTSYSGLATRIGQPEAARAVATILSKNPTPLVVPCHRVLYKDGRLGGFSAAGGTDLKQRMLALESQRG
jgi:methylated-DNA-[protein]-cysteine S-methyltransferase